MKGDKMAKQRTKRGGKDDPFHQRPAPEAKRAGGSGFGGIDKLTVRITKTSDGQRDYVQIMSADMVTVNVVLIAEKIEVLDGR
jgi:hypothetical protein